MNIRCAIAALVLSLSLVAGLHAQTCAAPIEMTSQFMLNGPHPDTTCSHPNTLQYLANGAISVSGEQMIYHIALGSLYAGGSITVTPAANREMSLFVCRGPCSTYSTCIAAVDNGLGVATTAQIPAGVGDYFVVVASTPVTTPSCGSYTLSTAFFLGD